MAEWTEKTSTFQSSDKYKIFYRILLAKEEKARMVISHGVGEHSGRYANVWEHLLPEGISLWILDHRGHGKSEGIRGHVASFDNYINDVHSLVQIARKDLPENMKFFLLGHSMGGLIALTYALHYPAMLDGVIASSPGLGMIVKVPAIKGMLGKLMSTLWPSLTLSNELDLSKISHDEQVVEAYKNDPLVHDRVSARWFTEFLSAMENVNKMVENLSIPILMLLAGDDHLVDAKASRKFFEKLKVEDKELHVYDGLYHEIFNAKKENRQKPLDDLKNWLLAQIKHSS